MKSLLSALLISTALRGVASAQTPPSFTSGQTLTAAELNAAIGQKQDALGTALPLATARGPLAATDLIPDVPFGATVAKSTTPGALANFPSITPYSCPGFVLGQADSTAFIQACLNTAAATGVWFDGLDIPINVNKLSVTASHSWIARLSLVEEANATTTDYSPLTVDGTASPVTDVVILDPRIDGNRLNQINIVGDGRRHGIALNGRLSAIYIRHPVVKNAATDCIRNDAAGVASASDTDYLQVNVAILEADLQGCGRWGWSGMSLQNFRLTGYASGNGMNLAGYPAAPYSSGGNARNFSGAVGGALYGGGGDFEDEGVEGGGGNGVEIDLVSLGNAGAVVVSSDKNPSTFPGFVTSKNITLRITGDVGDYGVGLGTVSVVNNVYTGAIPSFENVNVTANVRNDPMYFWGVDGLIVNAIHKVGLGSAGNYSANVRSSAHLNLNIVSDSTASPQIYFTSLPAAPTITQFYGAGWTSIGSQTWTLVGPVNSSAYRMSYAAIVVPAGAGPFDANMALASSSIISDVAGSCVDQTTGAYLTGNARWPGTGYANTASFGCVATSTDPVLVGVNMTVKTP